jgi:putative NADPH-quinone reductase
LLRTAVAGFHERDRAGAVSNHRGIFEFTGFEVLPPFVCLWSERVDPAVRAADIGALGQRITQLDSSLSPSHSEEAAESQA